MKKACLAGLVLLALMGAPGASGHAYGQAETPNIPENLSPGAIIQYNQQPGALHTAPKDAIVPGSDLIPVAPPPLPDIVIPEEPTPTPPEEITFFVDTIDLFGATRLSPQARQQLIAPYILRDLTMTDIDTLKEEITQAYLDMGYLVKVVLPPQTIKDFTLKLMVVEVKVDEVVFEKDRWFSARAVLPRVSADEGELLNVKRLQRSLKWINQNPDLRVSAVLAKGEETGGTTVNIKAEDSFPVHVTPFWDNLGRDSIGNHRYGVTLEHNNLLGFGDTLTTSTHFTRSSYGLYNRYAFPVGEYGTQLLFDYGYSNLTLGRELEPLDIQSRAHIFTPGVRQPLIQNRHVDASVSLLFDFKNLSTDLLGEPFYRDELRVLRPTANVNLYDRWGRTHINQELGLGLDVFGGSQGDTLLASKRGSGTQFFRYNGQVARVQKMPFGTLALVRGAYQLSPDRLVGAEQFQVGGAFSVRGYQEGVLIGDGGGYVSAEWIVPLRVFPSQWHMPLSQQRLNETVQLISFMDAGMVYVNRPVPGEIRHEYLASWGVGLRVRLTRLLVARLDLGFPMHRINDDNDQPRLHFGLQSNLL